MHNFFKDTTATAVAYACARASTNNISSDQEELVESLFSDEDDDDNDGRNDVDMVSDGILLDADETDDLVTISSHTRKYPDYNLGDSQTYHLHQQQTYSNVSEIKRSFIRLTLYGLALMATSFGLLVLLPLYQGQLEKQIPIESNSFGTILFVSPIVTLVLILITLLSSMAFKWNINVFQLPSIPIKRLVLISFVFGVSSATVLISSYKRVSCHLQDPLKAFALAFSLVFYFFLCKKAMGLQKIFSATTTVVGLFISMDYGLCDEFHCHGNVISSLPSTGWQGRAFWALTYTIGIFLWTLHLSLIEGCFVGTDVNDTVSNQNNLLKTISKFVSATDNLNDKKLLIGDHFPSVEDTDSTLTTIQNKKTNHPLHVVMWVHIIGTMFMILLGLFDVLPVSGTQIKSFAQHWSETKQTIVCHMGIGGNNELLEKSLVELDITTASGATFSDDELLRDQQILRESSSQHRTHFISSHSENENKSQPRKTLINSKIIRNINSHKNAFQKYKNATSNHMPSMSGKLENVGHKKFKVDCSHRGNLFVWLLICTYAGFVVCLFNFLNASKSAVFTVSLTTGTLPFFGLFWSFFKLETHHSKDAILLWSPSVSGELICSILGTPIVFMGIVFLFKAHYGEMFHLLQRSAVHRNP